MATRVQLVNAPRTGRVLRSPRYPFQISARPWQIVPFMIAPVLPGETMKNLLMQSRVVSDPVKHPLLGAHSEYYFFYVKHRDLEERDLLTEMMLNLNADLSSLNTAANRAFNHYGGIDWLKLCYIRIVEEYFRDEGEAWDDFMIGDYAIAAAHPKKTSWLDSVMPGAIYSGPDVDVDANSDDTITAGEIDVAMRTWEFLKSMNMTNQTYEDWLAAQGVRVPKAESHIPELVRYLREWTYPTNTVNPEDGTPTSAYSWSVAERADKDRFFREPGFLVGLYVMRPKVYLRNVKGNATSLMDDALSWLPKMMEPDPASSLKQVPDVSGPLGDVTDGTGYVVDIRDILLYGDQYTNLDLAATDKGFVTLPTPAGETRYTAGTDADALFVNASPGNTVRQDGIVTLNVLGSQMDHT